MHEAMVAENLLATMTRELADRNGRVLSAKISCGRLYAINDEALRFAFDALARGTACEGATLHIEHKPPRMRCTRCGYQFGLACDQCTCPQCGAERLELLADAPLLLEERELETE